jgi:hypothetical protein
MSKDDELLALSERLLQLANDEGTAQIHDVALDIRRLVTSPAQNGSPSDFRRLPIDVQCRCIRMWRAPDGSRWRCNPRAEK